MEYCRGRFRRAREDEQPSDTEDQGRYADEATMEYRAGGTPGGPYPQPPSYQGLELGEARRPYPVSRELLRSNPYPRLRLGETETGGLRAGTSPYMQPSMSREPEIGATPPLYPAVREPLRPIPGYHLRPGEVTIDRSATRRTLHARPPAFQGPKIVELNPYIQCLLLLLHAKQAAIASAN